MILPNVQPATPRTNEGVAVAFRARRALRSYAIAPFLRPLTRASERSALLQSLTRCPSTKRQPARTGIFYSDSPPSNTIVCPVT